MITTIIEEIKKDVAGALIINGWLGEGGTPVPQELAEYRADVCRTCPENVERNWWDRVKTLASDFIRSCLQVKNQLNLHVKDEDELAMCKVCGCCVQTKVWVPTKHIKIHPDRLDHFPSFCWIKKELEQQEISN